MFIDNAQKKQCIMVLGMHRSGTSALSGVLHILGMDIGRDKMGAAEENPKGFFENNQITFLNDRVMHHLGFAWDDPFPFPSDWWQQDCLAEYQQQFIEILETEFATTQLIGFKDPRICVLLPWWQNILQQCHFTPSYPIIYRHPLEVAASLAKRNQFSVQKSVMLWMKHMLDAERYTRHSPRCILSFEQLLAHPAETLTRLISVLQLAFPVTIEERQQEIVRFLEKDLKHHTVTPQKDDASCLPLAQDYYHLLQQLSECSENDSLAILQKIDDLRSRYEEWRSWFCPKELHVTSLIVNHQKAEIHQLKNIAIQHYVAQMFIDTGLGFNGTQVIIKPIQGQERIIEFDLCNYTDLCYLRFDPVNAPAAIHLVSIELLGMDGERYPITTYQTNACHENGSNFIFDTNDPIITFASPAARLQKVVLTLEYVALGNAAYPYIYHKQTQQIQQQAQQIQQQAQQIQQQAQQHDEVIRRYEEKLSREIHSKTQLIQIQDDMIQTMENTLSWKITKPLRVIRNYSAIKQWADRIFTMFRGRNRP